MHSPSQRLVATLQEFFGAGPSDDEIVVAFSGGPDSTALAWGLRELGRRRCFRIVLAHFDHGLDPGSADRAAGAGRIARELGLALVTGHGEHEASGRAGESPEEEARRRRYAFLKRTLRRRRARWIATAHHRDDQAETVALRMLFGSGLAGLSAIRARRGALVRPLLGLTRVDLAAVVSGERLPTVVDPTNEDLSVPRNLVRLRLLPTLGAGTAERCVRVAAAAAGANDRVGREVERMCPVRAPDSDPGLEVSELLSLPVPLRSWALGSLHRANGLPYPPRAAPQAELQRQLTAGTAVGCHAGDGWRWLVTNGRLVLREAAETPRSFTYTLRIPGKLVLEEISVVLTMSRSQVEPWMWKGASDRAALDLGIGSDVDVVVRTRRSGDRLRPLGCRYERRLKEVLIDHKVPRDVRGSIPLLCVGGRIAWVPGVTIDDRFRIRPGTEEVWTATLESCEG